MGNALPPRLVRLLIAPFTHQKYVSANFTPDEFFILHKLPTEFYTHLQFH